MSKALEVEMGFPKSRGTFLGIIVYWGLYWGPLLLGNSHIHRDQPIKVSEWSLEATLHLDAMHADGACSLEFSRLGEDGIPSASLRSHNYLEGQQDLVSWLIMEKKAETTLLFRVRVKKQQDLVSRSITPIKPYNNPNDPHY